ncbi:MULTISPECIES: VOC family protein [unclassified Brachybacterium]|uniref:VOC family protein n=1 Tax=unclassified Brachybacterium TaxID=2623841 RepID=UPI003614CAE7
MFLENIGIDATDPVRLGRFWEAALGTTALTVEDEVYETRLPLTDDAYLDLCFVRVPEPPVSPVRLHVDLAGGAEQSEVAERLRELGARDLDIGQGDVPWIVLGDVEGNPFCVMEHRDVYVETGPIAALPLDSADPQRDADFWSWLSGWGDAPGVAPRSLRHPSQRGPLLELCHESAPKGEGKNRMHLDIRLEPGDDADEVAAGIAERGGRELHPDWGELPWRVYADPSGNEFCVLPAPGFP